MSDFRKGLGRRFEEDRREIEDRKEKIGYQQRGLGKRIGERIVAVEMDRIGDRIG